MKILILTVNYFSDKELRNLINSILIGQKNVNDLFINLVILDNSNRTKKESEEFKREFDLITEKINIKVLINGINSGYFGGLGIFKESVKNNFYDFSIYSNPDILFDESFFKELVLCKKNGIISPAITTVDSGYSLNPLRVNRVKRRKIVFLKLVFSNIIFYKIYNYLVEIKEKYVKRKFDIIKEREIYSTHGSIFIFSDINFVKNVPLYPCFLFGEEIFIAEEAIIQNVKIYYCPKLIVRDIRHSALNLQTSEFKRKHSFDSIDYLLRKYFN